MAGRRIPYNPKPRLNTKANRLIALAEEQAMEVIATLMTENDSDLNENEADIRLMREIARRMRLRPMPVVVEDDCDIRTLHAIKARMELRKTNIERRARKIADQRRVIAQIGKAA